VLPSASSRAFGFLSCLLLVACNGSTSPSPSGDPPSGGTLRVAVVQNGAEALRGSPYYDPAVFAVSPLTRCCLLRTLLSYNGRPTEEGGAELRPDLADGLPRVSADGLTWTFQLRAGLRYAPPLATRAIEARDFITAVEHAVRFGESPFFNDIVGLSEFRDGSVDTIAGMEAPDANTLVIRLMAPAGDFGNRVALASMAPLPAEALEGRDDARYAGFLVASGPYMYEGADALDLANAEETPIWTKGQPGRATLIRNPSWSRDSDPLRGAYVDRIEAIMVADPDDGIALIESGEADLLAEPAPTSVAERYLANDELRGRLFAQAGMRVQYMSMNLAVPPFDDVHVRRAANLVIDRAAAAAAVGEEREAGTRVAHHAFPDALENALLRTYDPYPSNGDHGDIEGAREEMRQSAYDADGDGRCDARACSGVPAASIGEGVGSLVFADLAEIGIELVPSDADPFLPDSRVAAVIGIGWGADYPSGANFSVLLDSDGVSAEGLLNLSMVGASPEQLSSWGYDVTSVPSLDEKIDACLSAVGSAAFMCWAELDQLVMERVVAWVPLAFVDHRWVYSERVAEFSPDPDSIGPALDQIRLHPDE
jgi:ABC-type transport system substrate-binding protein